MLAPPPPIHGYFFADHNKKEYSISYAHMQHAWAKAISILQPKLINIIIYAYIYYILYIQYIYLVYMYILYYKYTKGRHIGHIHNHEFRVWLLHSNFFNSTLTAVNAKRGHQNSTKIRLLFFYIPRYLGRN